MLRMMGAVDASTLIVTSVHDSQVLEGDEIDGAKLLLHDVPVDVICTPTRARGATPRTRWRLSAGRSSLPHS